MRKTKAVSSLDRSSRTTRRALSPEGRENQMISLAVDLAEKQLMEGTASSQVITHYLKLGSMRERLEREKIERENELLRAKVESLQSMHHMEELYNKALTAFSSYRGDSDEDENV